MGHKPVQPAFKSCAVCRDRFNPRLVPTHADGRPLCATCQAIDRLLPARPDQATVMTDAMEGRP